MILITGANGNLGRRLIAMLTGRMPVRAVVRSERAARQLDGSPGEVDVRVIDYLDQAGMNEAARDCLGIVHLVGIIKESAGSSFEAAHEGTTRVVVAAAEQAGTQHLVYLSILGSRPDAENACLASKGRAEQIIEASNLIRGAGIELLTTNMLGLPGGTLAHDFETLALTHACKPAYANAFLYQPYPRTELGEYAHDNGYVEGDLEDIDPSAWERSVLRFSTPEEKRQIENLNKLFALAVQWPWLTGLVRRLIKLPPNPLFRLVYKLWKGYAIKNRIHPYRPSLREFVQTVRRFMSFV